MVRFHDLRQGRMRVGHLIEKQPQGFLFSDLIPSPAPTSPRPLGSKRPPFKTELIQERLIQPGTYYILPGDTDVRRSVDFLDYCINDKHDWLATAEFVKGLDLVITVDTAIAHLAGFLGVETWLLLPYVPDFRWGLEQTTTTPWYPSMRLYRQKALFA